jgi:hypothetical protein
VTRRLCTIAGFYKYAVEEELLDHSPAAHVRRPRLDYESHATALDRNELGALLVAAGLGSPAEHALISLLALNGLRVSEATGADIEHLGLERGHRTLVITRKGGKVVTIPLAPRTARAIDLATGERAEGPLFVTADIRRLDRHSAARIVRRVTRRAGIAKHVSPHTLRLAFITAALDAGVQLRDVQEAASHADPRTTMRYDRARISLDRPGRRRRPGCHDPGTQRRCLSDAATNSDHEPPICSATWSLRPLSRAEPNWMFRVRSLARPSGPRRRPDLPMCGCLKPLAGAPCRLGRGVGIGRRHGGTATAPHADKRAAPTCTWRKPLSVMRSNNPF